MSDTKEHLLWGTFTWILLHWISQQIKEEFFIEEKDNLIYLVKGICGNLPCPNCREHALLYLKTVPISYVKTKDDLINYIYHFHNSVNVRGKKQYEPFSIMEKYKRVNFTLMLNSWNARFEYGNDIQRNDFMAKNRLVKIKNEVNSYLKKNAHKFLMS